MAQIRWRRARPALQAELESHLLCQMEECVAAGMTEEEAAAETVRQMGDPAETGAALDAVHRPAIQGGLLALTVLLALGGGFLRVWLTEGLDHGAAADPNRTALALCLGTVCLLGAYLGDYTVLCRHGKAVYAGMLLLTVASWELSPVVNCVPYFSRYLTGLSPVVYALWLCAWRGQGWKGLAASIAGGVPLGLVCLLTLDLRGALCLCVTGLVLLTAAVRWDWFGPDWRRALALVWGTAVCVAAGAGMAFRQGFGQARLLMALHPEVDPLGSGYQAMTVRRALSGVRWLGDSGTADWSMVPEAHQDFLPMTMACRLGWLPVLLLAGAVLALLVLLLVRAGKQGTAPGRLLAVSVSLLLGLRLACSVVMNLGFVLFSAQFPLLVGNLQAVVDLALTGLGLSVLRQAHLPVWNTAPAAARPPREAVKAE